jgi:hypothetical protein
VVALTSIVANDKVDIGAEGEWAQESVTHEVLEGDALHDACFSLLSRALELSTESTFTFKMSYRTDTDDRK